MIHVGFTGTRYGMSGSQYCKVQDLLWGLQERHGHITVHHGACVGADTDFHYIARNMGLSIVRHPPVSLALLAFLEGGVEMPPLPYDKRNQAIVDASELVIAAPLQEEPQARGGTWQTIRFAQTKGNLWRIVFPSGVAVEP